MPLFKVLSEQVTTKKVLVVVEATSDKEAMLNVFNGDIISVESSVGTELNKFIPIKVDKY